MKQFNHVFSSMLLAGSCMIGCAFNAEASNHLGLYCWNLNTNDGSGTLKLAVTDMGDQHFTVNGVISSEEDSEIVSVPVYGSVEIAGDGVIVAMNSAKLDEKNHSMSTESWSMNLNLPGLDGKFMLFGQDYSGDHFEPLNFTEGTVILTQCL